MGQQTRVGKVATQVLTEKAMAGNDVTKVIYHGTVVVSFTRSAPGTMICLDSGGWRTATTKTRMNQASAEFRLGFSVFQKKYEWFVDLPDGREEPFTDKMYFVKPA